MAWYDDRATREACAVEDALRDWLDGMRSRGVLTSLQALDAREEHALVAAETYSDIWTARGSL